MPEHQRSLTAGFVSGVLIGALAGLIGLGGAEFRLPLLIGIFGFVALEAVILNKATSLIVVGSALAFRSREIPFTAMIEHAQIVLTLLSGSLLGAWFGADLATRIKTHVSYRVIAALLFCIALYWSRSGVRSSPGACSRAAAPSQASVLRWHASRRASSSIFSLLFLSILSFAHIAPLSLINL